MKHKIVSKTKLFALIFVITGLIFIPLDYSAGFASAQPELNPGDISDPYQGMQLQGVSVVHLDDPEYRVFLPVIVGSVPVPNRNPTDITLSNSGILENQAINTVVGSFSTVDPDIGNTFTYSLVSGSGDADNAAFNIAADQLRSSQTFDYETKSSYLIRVRTTDQGGLFYEKAFTITVSDIFEGASLVNGDFEQGSTGWTVDSDHSYSIIVHENDSTHSAHNGEWLAWLGVFSNENSSITQSVMVPSASSYLRFWYWIESWDDCGNAFFWIKANGVAVQTSQLCTTQNTGGWVQGSVDLSAYAGTTILLKFHVLTDVDFISNVFLDDIVFASSAAASP